MAAEIWDQDVVVLGEVGYVTFEDSTGAGEAVKL
jgi:hypothetical protein